MFRSHNKVKYNHTHAFDGTWWYNYYRLLFTGDDDVHIYIVMQLRGRILVWSHIISHIKRVLQLTWFYHDVADSQFHRMAILCFLSYLTTCYNIVRTLHLNFLLFYKFSKSHVTGGHEIWLALSSIRHQFCVRTFYAVSKWGMCNLSNSAPVCSNRR